MPLDWSILRENQPVDIAGNFATGYKMGSALIDKVHQNNALASLAQNPEDNAALSTLYQVNPGLASSLETRHVARKKFADEQAALARRTALGTQYAGGDTTGAEKAAVSQGDFDVAAEFSKLDETQQKKAGDFWEKAGPIAYQLQQTKDPAQRQALWAQARPILLSEGVDTDLVNKFDPTNDAQLNAAVTTAQKVSDLVSQNKIEWHQQGENPSFATNAMGVPVGTANPATAGSLPRVTDKNSYDAVPPGGHYLDPNGHMRVKGGQSASPAGGFP